MIIDFNEINEVTIPGMNDGTGTMAVRMYHNERYRIVFTTLHPGGSIGLHTQTNGDDMNYVISGSGKAFCDGKEEILRAGGDAHLSQGLGAPHRQHGRRRSRSADGGCGA